MQAQARSPHQKSSHPSLSPTRAPEGHSMSSAQRPRKPAQSKRAVRGEILFGLDLNKILESNAVSTFSCTCCWFPLKMHMEKTFFVPLDETIRSLMQQLVTEGAFLTVVFRPPTVLKRLNQAENRYESHRRVIAKQEVKCRALALSPLLLSLMSSYLLLAPVALRGILRKRRHKHP